MMDVVTAPVVTCDRLRMQTDGKGITTLVCFHSCPLRCKWCINPFSFAPDTKRTVMTAQALFDKVKVDQLYFLATGGGVTFGGGEPLLYPEFMKQFRDICGESWHLCAETSLNVPWENVQIAATCIDKFYIDCKDTDPDIYRSYTGRDNDQMLSNLQKLISIIGPDRIVVRIPLIPEFNTNEHRQKSKAFLEKMGITQFNFFNYIIRKSQKTSDHSV